MTTKGASKAAHKTQTRETMYAEGLLAGVIHQSITARRNPESMGTMRRGLIGTGGGGPGSEARMGSHADYAEGSTKDSQVCVFVRVCV
jgi:hypothetical protein